jgi:hypothetical protein
MDNAKYNRYVWRQVWNTIFLLPITSVQYVFSQIKIMVVMLKTNVMAVVLIEMTEFYTNWEMCKNKINPTPRDRAFLLYSYANCLGNTAAYVPRAAGNVCPVVFA